MATELIQYIFSRQEKLMLDLLKPLASESILHVECGAGRYFRLIQQKKCVLTRFDASADVSKSGRIAPAAQNELIQSDARSLPFSDNEFDVVVLNGPQIPGDPQKLLAEAVRVSRNRVFVGFYHKYSLAGTEWSVRKLFGLPGASRFFSITEMKSIIRQAMPNPYLTWGSVIYFPAPVYSLFSELEEIFPMKKNPLGAFVGMAFPVRYSFRTLQTPIINSIELKAKSPTTMPETVRSMLQGGDR